jgi:hypothetical protein
VIYGNQSKDIAGPSTTRFRDKKFKNLKKKRKKRKDERKKKSHVSTEQQTE